MTISSPGSSCPRFAGTFTSADLATNGVDSNATNHDALDIVTYGVVLENV